MSCCYEGTTIHVQNVTHGQQVEGEHKHLCGTDQEAHPSIDTEYWIPISPDSIESVMLSCDTDPKLWKEAMASYDTAEWAEGLKEEIDSLQAHEVFTLVPKSSVAKGHQIDCHRKHNKKGEVIC